MTQSNHEIDLANHQGTGPVYLWLDLETTGLIESHLSYPEILEVAWTCTGTDLVPVFPIQSRLIETGHQLTMKPVVWQMHSESGLLDDYVKGPRLNLAKVIGEIAADLIQFGSRPVHLAGSGVHFDHQMLRIWAPEFIEGLHYRLIDVSVVGRFLTEVGGLEFENRPTAHRAADDVKQAIQRAMDYRDELVRVKALL